MCLLNGPSWATKERHNISAFKHQKLNQSFLIAMKEFKKH